MCAFDLTEQGIQEAMELTSKRGPEPAVLTFMLDKGCGAGKGVVVELDDVIAETRMSDEKATSVLRRLVNLGYIEEI